MFNVHGIHFQGIEISVVLFSLFSFFILFSFRVSVQYSWYSLSGNADFACFVRFSVFACVFNVHSIQFQGIQISLVLFSLFSFFSFHVMVSRKMKFGKF